tara:strand:- start:311 stop:499 length:189 start_codon:yes stop_codon:yes gene_type:complete
MKIKHGLSEPKDYHAECEIKGCGNYFNITYKDTNGMCKRCNQIDEKFKNGRNRPNMEIYHAD